MALNRTDECWARMLKLLLRLFLILILVLALHCLTNKFAASFVNYDEVNIHWEGRKQCLKVKLREVHSLYDRFDIES